MPVSLVVPAIATATLASLVAASPIPVSLADGKELEHLLKNLRRAMSVDLQYTWTKKWAWHKAIIKCVIEISAIQNYALVQHLAFFAFVCSAQLFLALRYTTPNKINISVAEIWNNDVMCIISQRP